MIYIKSKEQIDLMRKSGKILSNALKLAEKNAVIGTTTNHINKIVHDYIIKNDAIPSFLNYNGFPASICASVNEVVVHGIPNDKPLKNGDILSVDIGVCYKGMHTDAARTFAIGKISKEDKSLIERTKQSFIEGTKNIKSGSRVGDISEAIETYINQFGYGIVRDLAGHGVGVKLHEDPMIPNFVKIGRGARLESGMTIAIEPMINLGTWQVVLDGKDGWTIRTADGKKSAHHENTILITENGIEILTSETEGD